MADKSQDKQAPSKAKPAPAARPDKKASETVNLTADDLKRISGGAIKPPPPTKTH